MEREILNRFDLVSLIRDLVREWLSILLIALSAGMLAGLLVSVTYVPVYSTSTTMIVTNKGANSNVYQNLTAARDLAVRFSTVLESNLLKKTVQEELGLNSFDAVTKVEQVEETNLLELNVSGSTPMETYRITQCILENYDKVSDYVLGNVIVEVLQEPTIPMAPNNSKSLRKVMRRGFLAGGAVAALLVLVLSFIRDTVKNEEQLKNKVDAKFLGTVYHEKKYARFRRRKGEPVPSMLIDNQLRSYTYIESNRMAASSVRSKLEHRSKKVVMVTSVMENEGKSTVAANISLALAQEGMKVLLIDCDFRKPSQYKIFSNEENGLSKEEVDMTKALRTEEKMDAQLRQYGDTGLYLLCGTVADQSFDYLIASGAIERMLNHYHDRFDFIVLDTAPMALVSDTEELARFADATVLVIREDVVPTRQINDTIDILNNTKAKVLGAVFSNSFFGLGRSLAQYGYGNYGGRYGGYYGK